MSDTDGDILRQVAELLDEQDRQRSMLDGSQPGNAVQVELRRIAERLDDIDQTEAGPAEWVELAGTRLRLASIESVDATAPGEEGISTVTIRTRSGATHVYEDEDAVIQGHGLLELLTRGTL
jgi:hypothetical protein